MSSVFNIWDQSALTVLTQSAVDRVLGSDRERIATQFAPLEPTRSDKIARERVKVRAVGKGRIVADDATPPIYRPQVKLTQEAWELLRNKEMTPIEESLRRQLENNGTDPDSVERRRRAGVDIVTRGRAIQVRNENESDYLTMYALLHGELPIQVANPPAGSVDTEYIVDYEFPTGHLTTVSTSFATIASATPVTYFRAWQERLKEHSGSFGIHFWLSSEVWQYILHSTQVKDSFYWNTPNTAPFIPTVEQFKQLLHEPDRVEIHVEDSGWYEESAGYNVELDASKTRWIPTDRVLVTTEDPHKGERIALNYDGMVPVQTNWNEYVYRGPGPQTYTQLIQENLTLMIRNEMRRMPIIHKPECVISAKVIL